MFTLVRVMVKIGVDKTRWPPLLSRVLETVQLAPLYSSEPCFPFVAHQPCNLTVSFTKMRSKHSTFSQNSLSSRAGLHFAAVLLLHTTIQLYTYSSLRHFCPRLSSFGHDRVCRKQSCQQRHDGTCGSSTYCSVIRFSNITVQ